MSSISSSSAAPSPYLPPAAPPPNQHAENAHHSPTRKPSEDFLETAQKTITSNVRRYPGRYMAGAGLTIASTLAYRQVPGMITHPTGAIAYLLHRGPKLASQNVGAYIADFIVDKAPSSVVRSMAAATVRNTLEKAASEAYGKGLTIGAVLVFLNLTGVKDLLKKLTG